MLLRLALVALCATGLCACLEDPTPERFSPDAGMETDAQEARFLLFQTPNRMLLEHGEERRFEVLLIDADAVPIPGEEVSFLLDGMAGESSLLTVADRTNADGLARGELRAGYTNTSFRLRVSAEGAEPIHANVIVRAEDDLSADGTTETVILSP